MSNGYVYASKPRLRVRAILTCACKQSIVMNLPSKQNRRPTPTLRRRLVSLVLICLVPAALGLTIEAWHNRDRQIASAYAAVSAEAQLAVAAQQRQFASIRETLAGIAMGDAADIDDAEDCRRLRRQLAQFTSFANAGVIDRNGVLLCALVPGMEGGSLTDRRYVREALASRRMVVSELITGRMTGQRSIVFAHPRLTAGGVFNGVVFGAYKDSNFATLRLNDRHFMSTRFTYFDRNGMLITVDPPGQQPFGPELADEDFLRLREGGADPVNYVLTAADKTRHLAALMPIEGLDGPVGYVRTMIDERDVLQTWRGELYVRILIVLAMIIAGLVAGGWHLEHWLVRDLRRMVDFTRAATESTIVNWPVRARTAEARKAFQSVVSLTELLQEQRAQLQLLHGEASQANERLETKRRKLSESLVRLESMSKQLVDTQERERRSLARELHDEFGQRLTRLSLLLHAVMTSEKNGETSALCREAQNELAELTAQVRELSVSLRPPALDHMSLEAAIEQMVTRQLMTANLKWDIEFAGVPANLSDSVSITAYRLIQESLTNIIKHAQASEVRIEINGGGDGRELELIVRDNGRGFDCAALSGVKTVSQSGSSGMLGMRERVQLLGGSFSIDSAPQRGTRITATLPVQRESVAA